MGGGLDVAEGGGPHRQPAQGIFPQEVVVRFGGGRTVGQDQLGDFPIRRHPAHVAGKMVRGPGTIRADFPLLLGSQGLGNGEHHRPLGTGNLARGAIGSFPLDVNLY